MTRFNMSVVLRILFQCCFPSSEQKRPAIVAQGLSPYLELMGSNSVMCLVYRLFRSCPSWRCNSSDFAIFSSYRGEPSFIQILQKKTTFKQHVADSKIHLILLEKSVNSKCTRKIMNIISCYLLQVFWVAWPGVSNYWPFFIETWIWNLSSVLPHSARKELE